MATSADVREAARVERDRLQSVCDGADLALVMVAYGAGTIQKEFVLVALVPAILRWRASKEKLVQQRLYEDPPRYDYTEPVEVTYEVWNRDLFSAKLQDSGPLLLNYVDASMRLVALETAMIAAVEKQLGALEQGEPEFARARELEAEFLAADSALALTMCASALDRVASRGWIGEEESEARLAATEPLIRQALRAAAHNEQAPKFPALPDRLHSELHELGIPPDALPAPGSPIPEFPAFPREAITNLRGRLFYNAATKRGLSAVLDNRPIRSATAVRF